jgi:predicted benzoate:H+ symporter BenE
MRNTLFFLTMAAGLAIACMSNAGAVPMNVAAVKEAATSSSSVQPARWRRWPRGHTKCYREFVIGPYSCHWFPL